MRRYWSIIKECLYEIANNKSTANNWLEHRHEIGWNVFAAIRRMEVFDELAVKDLLELIYYHISLLEDKHTCWGGGQYRLTPQGEALVEDLRRAAPFWKAWLIEQGEHFPEVLLSTKIQKYYEQQKID